MPTPIPEYQQRVLDEKKALDEKISKLEAFFKTPVFADLAPGPRGRLSAQCAHMKAYSSTLHDRIVTDFGIQL